MATSFSGGGSRNTWREPPVMGKQLENFITCGCESRVHPFCNLQSRARTHAVLVIGLYELLDPTTSLIEPPGPLIEIYIIWLTNLLTLRWYHTLQGDNYLKSVERFDHMMFVCRFQASRWIKTTERKAAMWLSNL